ncbi:hypothetical protein [Altericista sp. CCNU0014]|uniref:hypothetical protein n=1 Tax=Altericista sp. CCNU0014 TaxID=3082949 RepID=UPI00384A8998
MRRSVISSLLVGGVLSIGSVPALAQTNPSAPTAPSPVPAASSPDVYFINRAKNLARQAAISANGGLLRYRPDPAMFGPAVQTQYLRNADGSITFTFTGSSPGGPNPTIETVATVAPSGTVKLDYNGPLRNVSAGSLPVTAPATNQTLPVQIPVPNPGQPPTSGPSLSTSNPTDVKPAPAPGGGDRSTNAWIEEDAFFARARNLARQAAIKANGGLSRYRPEAAMFGPSAQTPAVKNANGSITFKFKGGAPGTAELPTESVVTVNPAGSVNLEYNGPVR